MEGETSVSCSDALGTNVVNVLHAQLLAQIRRMKPIFLYINS
jgi:hypothetical protein